MPRSWIRVLWVASSFFAMTLGTARAAAQSSYLRELEEQARNLALATDPAWQSLLFYAPRALTGPRSLLSSPGFFLAKGGRGEPAAELEATLTAFFLPASDYKDLNQHPQCAYPARYHWLKDKLKFDPARLAELRCADLLGFKERLAVDRVFLVFSSFYLNNPSSMYGHTFLRLKRRGVPGQQRAAMMDYAVNFAAQLDDPQVNGLEYALRGLFGGYPGRYDVTRYYVKVQEYNNHESRDLWEYELALNAAEQERLVESLWEFGPYHTDYYYFDDNCSYAILALLQAAKPGLDVLRSFPHAWVIPSDTVRVVRDAGGLTGRVDFHASSFSRYEARLSSLRAGDELLLRGLLEAKNKAAAQMVLTGEAPIRRAELIDAVLEFIDYEEKLAGTKVATTYGDTRRMLLQLRSEVAIASPPLPPPPRGGRPDLGHGSTRHSLEQGSSKEFGPYTQFEWRPALHELADLQLGYSPNLQLRFFDTAVRYEESQRSFSLKSWELIEVLSLAPLRPLITPLSWHLAFGLEQLDECTAVPDCYRLRLTGGPGLSAATGDGAWQLFAIPELDVGYANAVHFGAHIGPAVFTGLVWRPAQPLRLVLTGRERLSYGRSLDKARAFTAILAYSFSASFDLRLQALKSDQRSEASVNLGYFW